MKLPVIKPVAAAVSRAVTARRGWGTGSTPFNSGLWNHAAATVSGGSQILGANRYRIYSATGAISQVTVPGILVSGRAYQFQMAFETPVLGTQIQVGDAGANVDDFVSSLAGTRTVAFVADGTVATLKRPFVVSSGIATDVVVKDIAVTDITATALVITSQPSPTAVVDGSAATFSVAVAAPFSAVFYQWEVSTNGGGSWAAYVGGTGATTNTLTTAAMTLGDNGELFRCRIRMGSANNTIGQIYSTAATLTVTAANANPVAPTLALGDLTVDTGLVLSSTDLLAGATDADGDTLTVTSVTAVSGGTVSGTGPWTITPSATGAGSATVVISDGRGGSVNRTVTWNGVPAGLSGGTPALAWTAASLDDGAEVTITTDGTYNFGFGPSAFMALGFGSGVLADTAEGAPVAAGTYGDFVVVEGNRSKAVTKDGTRTFYTRIRDASWDLGEQHSAGRAGWVPGVAFENGMKICQVGMVRLESSSSADCQFKSLRFEVDTIDDDSVTSNEFYARSFRSITNAIAIYDAAEAVTNAGIRHPHTNYGWCCHDLMITSSTPSVADGSVLSRLAKQDGLPPQETLTTGVRFADSASARRANRFVRQDYFGPDTLVPVDLWRADTIWQVGSFAHVKIGNAPTPAEATLPPVPCGPVNWSANSVTVRKWSPLLAALGATAQYLWIYNDAGQFVASVLLSGSYTPPAYNPATDLIGLSRGTGAAGSGRIVFDSDLAAPTGGQVATLSAWIKPASLARRNGFIDGRTTANTHWCVFEADGSITARIGATTRTLRAAGEHVLVSGQRHLIAARWSASLFEVLVDGNVVGSYSGSTAGFLPGRVMEGNNVGFNGVCYNITYAIDGTATNRAPLNEGTGTAAGTPVAADIGAINGTITSGMTWVAA